MEKIFASLNTPQAQAVQHMDGPLLVLAGAGTGKTRVLTTRLAHILSSGRARPAEILAVTFTNKAAREMAERVEELIGVSSAGMWLGTFHSLGARFLRRHAELANLGSDFTILDTDDQKRLLKQVMEEAGIDDTRWPVRTLLTLISRWKDNAWRPEDVPEDESRAFAQRGAALYALYQRRLEALNAADFGDLLLKPFLLLKNNPEVLAKYQNMFRYVLVDEYQDTNSVQYLWLRLLVMGHKNICVVGDDDQSIYAWRGAQVENILRFEKDFPGAQVVRLEQNYRSTGNILKAASGLISHNSGRHEKTLWTEMAVGEKIEVHPVFDGREEARLIADRVERILRDGGSYDDCAVLVRTAAQTRAIEEKFMQAGIPYQIVGGLRFYERKEIRDAVAYLRLVASGRDALAFERVINVPRRGIGESTLQALSELAKEKDIPLPEAAREAVRLGVLPTAAHGRIKQFMDMLESWRARSGETTLDRLMESVLEESGYNDMLRADKNKDEARARMENLRELVRALQEYSDLQAFLEHVSLVMDGDAGNQESTVRMTTVHAAKGLEFHTVFLPGFEDGLFPHQRSLNEEGAKGLEEERRLAYVAITRARRRLIISYASSRQMYGRWEPSAASRFLEEMPQDVLHYVTGSGARPSWRPAAGSSMDGSRKGEFGKPREPLFGMATPTSHAPKSESGLDVGARVFHDKFGYGRIRRSEGKGERQKVTILFEKAGSKTLLAGLANLEVVG